MTIKINENFFDRNSKSVEEQKIQLYVIGASFANYSRIYDGRPLNIWQSSSKPPLEIINSSLEREGKIYGPIKYKNIREGGDDFVIYRIKIYNEKIYGDITEWGLNVPKSEREFPTDIGYTSLIPFLRGFLDEQASCGFRTNILKDRNNKQYQYHYPHLSICYDSVEFLNGLYSTLVKYEIVKDGKNIIKSPLVFRGEDVLAIEHLIYNMDWAFSEEHGLYLDSKKELFELAHKYNLPTNFYALQSSKKIDTVINLLLDGETPSQIVQQLVYSNVFRLYTSFKKVTGQTIGEFRNSDEFSMLSEIHKFRNST